jgi:hypothetical protein
MVAGGAINSSIKSSIESQGYKSDRAGLVQYRCPNVARPDPGPLRAESDSTITLKKKSGRLSRFAKSFRLPE